MVKIALILFLAHFLTQRVNHIQEFLQGLLLPLGITWVLVGLIVKQPDFGTAVMIAAMALMMIYMAGGRFSHLAGSMPAHPRRGRLLV